MRGIVETGSKNIFAVICEDGVGRLCSIKGKKLKGIESFYNPLAAGDEVELSDIEGERARIVSVLDRKNQFVRWNEKGRGIQLLAANLDCLACITSPCEPPFRPRFIDRLLVQAEYERIRPLIVCNKTDLGINADTQKRLCEWKALGYEVIRVSAKTGEGIGDLVSRLKGRRTAFIGQSGVGKSSLLNTLDPAFDLKTAALSEKYDRGVHTTTRGMLLRITLDGVESEVIDTPGVRRFVPYGIEARELLLYFPEFRSEAGSCLFGMSCSHISERGCRVLEALNEGRVSRDRYESWLRIRAELEAALRF